MKIDLLIGGGGVQANAGATYERLNPIDGTVATVAAAATTQNAIAAADAAARAFPVWSATGPNARRTILLKAADVMEAHVDDFVQAMTAETGATAGWARFNVMLGASNLREAASMTTQIHGEVIPSDRPGCTAMSVRQAAGVVLGIAPWNAPVILGVRALAMPLACGNTVVLKASEACPATHRLIGQVLQEAGLPDGAVNVVTNAPKDAADVVAALIAHPAVRRINFTGSTKVGRIIAETAGRYLKPVLLELGGKAPMVILDDANLDDAVNAATFGAFMNQGQICMSTERIIVDEAIAEAFVKKFVAKVARLPVGDPRRGDVALGAVVSLDAAKHVGRLARDAAAKGANLALDGGVADSAILPPTIVDRVTSDMAIYREESFGPIVAIIRAHGDDDAVRLANDTEYGLAAAVFSRDISRAMKVAARINSGICHINGPTVHDEAQMPFGGMGASGYGRFGGRASIAEFTDLRWITISADAPHYPF
ncbi:MAG: aldehyde dehydrogenase [Rhodopila sp.]|jgi:acyl-CoA reductase-like NAD-dependent aldehyde dehydrogenase